MTVSRKKFMPMTDHTLAFARTAVTIGPEAVVFKTVPKSSGK